MSLAQKSQQGPRGDLHLPSKVLVGGPQPSQQGPRGDLNLPSKALVGLQPSPGALKPSQPSPRGVQKACICNISSAPNLPSRVLVGTSTFPARSSWGPQPSQQCPRGDPQPSRKVLVGDLNLPKGSSWGHQSSQRVTPTFPRVLVGDCAALLVPPPMPSEQ